MNFPRRTPFAIVALAIVAVLALLPACSGKSLAITGFVVEATVQPDGSMVVTEHLTYDFRGDWNGGERFMKVEAGEQIVDVTVSEGGRNLQIVDPDPRSLRWRGAGPIGKVTGLHTYDVSYRVLGAVRVAPDVAELYWQFVGEGFPFLDRVEINVTVPGAAEGIEAFAHGALNGVVDLSGNQVKLTVTDNPAGTFVEARILAPASGFTVAPTGAPIRDDILAEERRWAADSDQLREDLRNRIERDDLLETIGHVAGVLLAVVIAAMFWVIFRMWGKEPKRPDDIGEYWREVPVETPAVCKTVLDFGSVGHDALSYTLLDLAQRGHLTITETDDGYRFAQREAPAEAETAGPVATGTRNLTERLTGYEEQALDWLFADGPSITQDELTARATADRDASVAWIDHFKHLVREAAESYDFVDRRRPEKWLMQGSLIAASLIFGLVVLLVLESMAGWLLLALAVALLPLSFLLRKRTPAGARKAAELQGLRRFLRDFSRLDEEDTRVGDLALYERYLVYAVMLGVAKELVEGLRIKVPEVAAADSGFAPWYVGATLGHAHYGAPSGLAGIGSVGAFAAEFTSATAAAMSPPSSTGSGGGFSGGGGGGGGGGAGGW